LPGEAFVMPGCRRRRSGARLDGPVHTAITGVGRRRRRVGGGPLSRNSADSSDAPSPDHSGGPAATDDSDRAD
jgi:hypothetical protein